MAAYLVRRVIHGVFVLFGVSIIVFGLIKLSGDPARLFLPLDATEEDRALFRRQMGWDRPLPVQYADFLGGALRGDFGTSIRHQQPALQLVLQRLPATTELTAAALLFALAIAVPAGIVAAVRRNTPLDFLSMSFALLGQTTPVFLIGILLILVFAVDLGWFPAGGREGLRGLVLPGITLGAYSAAILARLLKSKLLEVLGQEYVRTARAKGLRERAVMARHVIKNAAIPVVTVIGLQVGTLFAGAVITETVFSYPGMGRLAVQAIADRDYPVVQAFVVVVAVIVLLANLAVDFVYTLIDPRVRVG